MTFDRMARVAWLCIALLALWIAYDYSASVRHARWFDWMTR